MYLNKYQIKSGFPLILKYSLKTTLYIKAGQSLKQILSQISFFDCEIVITSKENPTASEILK